MLIKKLLENKFEDAVSGHRLEPAQVSVLASEITGNACANDRDQSMARRARRQRRNTRQAVVRNGGWVVRAW